MITTIFTDQRLTVYGHGTPSGITQLLDTELAGRSYPMTSSLHVFLNTIINRYKDEMIDVFYPLSINIVFPTRSYFSEIDRKHLLDYILTRRDVIKLRSRKNLMQATIEGWCQNNDVQHPAWLGLSIYEDMLIGAKENDALPLKIKSSNDAGRSDILRELVNYVDNKGTVQEVQILKRVDHLGQTEVDQILNNGEVELKFKESQEVPDTTFVLKKEFRSKILKNKTNVIFSHINNLYAKLPNGKPLFFLGSFVNNQMVRKSLKKSGLKYDYETVFIEEDDLPTLAAVSFEQNRLTQAPITDQDNNIPIDNSIIPSGTVDLEDPSQTAYQDVPTIESNISDPKDQGKYSISDEFVITKRFKGQEFLLFKGYKKSQSITRFFRFISHKDYKALNKRAAFIKLYKKVKTIYPEISTLVYSNSGRYFYLEDNGAKPLTQVIARSRMKKTQSGSFKSEDIKLLVDIYQKLKELPITFQNLTAENIYIRQKEWWRMSQTNEVYFLGITSADSTKEVMTRELDRVIRDLVHPTIIERINEL